jgi:flagellar biosynthesis protein FliR
VGSIFISFGDFVGRSPDLPELVLQGMLLMFRILPIVFLTPFLGGKLVPATTKMGISFAMALLLFPGVTSMVTTPMASMSALVFIPLMLKELFIGYVIGFVASEIFYAMEIGGRVLDVMRGSNMAEVQVPELGFRASPLGLFLFQMLLIVFLGVGGHRLFIEAFSESYAMVTLDQFPTISGGFFAMVDAIMVYTASLFAIAFALVFPGIFATFMTDVVFGMLNRIAPQLNAYFMAMGVKAMSAIVLLLFSLSLVYARMVDLTAYSLRFVRDLVKLWA